MYRVSGFDRLTDVATARKRILPKKEIEQKEEVGKLYCKIMHMTETAITIRVEQQNDLCLLL